MYFLFFLSSPLSNTSRRFSLHLFPTCIPLTPPLYSFSIPILPLSICVTLSVHLPRILFFVLILPYPPFRTSPTLHLFTYNVLHILLTSLLFPFLSLYLFHIYLYFARLSYQYLFSIFSFPNRFPLYFTLYFFYIPSLSFHLFIFTFSHFTPSCILLKSLRSFISNLPLSLFSPTRFHCHLFPILRLKSHLCIYVSNQHGNKIWLVFPLLCLVSKLLTCRKSHSPGVLLCLSSACSACAQETGVQILSG